MIIKLTLASNRQPLGVRAGDIRQVMKDPENPLVTAVWTGIATAQGPQMFAVLEGVEEVISLANQAWDRMRGVNHEPSLPGERKLIA